MWGGQCKSRHDGVTPSKCGIHVFSPAYLQCIISEKTHKQFLGQISVIWHFISICAGEAVESLLVISTEKYAEYPGPAWQLAKRDASTTGACQLGIIFLLADEREGKLKSNTRRMREFSPTDTLKRGLLLHHRTAFWDSVASACADACMCDSTSHQVLCLWPVWESTWKMTANAKLILQVREGWWGV